jgi:hypothetical protein
MLPIPLKHVHTLRINFTDSDYDNLVPAMALLLKGAAKVRTWTGTRGYFWLIYKACSYHEGTVEK